MTGSSTLNYILGDHLALTGCCASSASVTTDSAGNNAVYALYKPWGESRYNSGALPTKYTYTGQYSNMSDFGLMYYNARYYDPYLNRWVQPDTIIPDPGNPQDWNRYSYVRDNPLKYTDPDGHFPWPVVLVLVIAAVVLTGDTAVESPPPPNYPVNSFDGWECDLSVAGCFGDAVKLKDFSDNGTENPIPIEEFNELADEVAYDLYSHDLTWPGYVSGRHLYDTPFYNGGESKKRTDDPNSEKGKYPSNQQVCIESVGCSGRSEINYIAQGMWGAAVGEPKIVSYGITAAWKLWEYHDWPSPDTFFWLDYGYDYYNQWEESQAK